MRTPSGNHDIPEHRCKQTRLLALVGVLLMCALGWLFTTVHAAEIERAVLKTKLESMAADVAAIRATLEDALKQKVRP